MIWRWLIFSKLAALRRRSPARPAGALWPACPRRLVCLLCCLCLTMPAGLAATVSGALELTNSKDISVRKHKDYSGVVLWLEAVNRQAPVFAGRRVEMLQKDKHFAPHVVAIPVGGTVDFPNLDPIFHSAFSNFSGQPFDVGLYPPGTSKSVTFKHPGIVRVFCNIHSTMSAIIAVLPTLWFTVTQVSGKYSIPNVPPGEYGLRMFHERALPENLEFLEHRITVPEGGLVLPLVSISETGFIPVAHLNKFGKEYPPPPANGGTYPGAPKQ
jgi:plastocyanin